VSAKGMTEWWRAHAHSGARRLWHGGSNCSSGHDATQSYTLWLEAAVRATLEGEAAPRHHAVERLAPCGKKRALRRVRVAELRRAGG
jgi:hypothetical protein